MGAIITLFRVVFLFIIYSTLCSFFVFTLFGESNPFLQLLVIIGVPVMIIRWQERRRAQRKILQASTKKSSDVNELSEDEDDLDDDEIYAKSESHPPAPNRSAEGDWIPANKTVTVAGRNIGGMVYVGKAPTITGSYGYGELCRAYIDPKLSVARNGTDKEGQYMEYWPCYSEISKVCRATYLDWLAGGRKDNSYNPGYMFLYFYGLERRFFVDDSAEEAQEIIDEVKRLRSLYPQDHSVKRYLGEFLDVATLKVTDFHKIEPIFESHGWELPFSIKCAIGTRLNKGENLNADWVLSWFMCHPESHLRTPASRCRDEFIALFRARFDARFPEGLKVTKPRKNLKAYFHAASSEFRGTLEPTVDDKPIPDITNIRKPVEIAQEIADEAMEDLDKLSRYLGRNPDARGSVEAHALLPTDLWEIFPSEEMKKIKSWAHKIVEKGGLVPLKDVIKRLEGKGSQKIDKRQIISAADALARLGFGLAPDPRFALRSPKSDEPVVIFDLGNPVEKLEDVSEKYQGALMNLALGSFIAHADGRFVESEWKEIEAQATATKGLNKHEKARLDANLKWFKAVSPDITFLRRKLQEIGEDGQNTIRAVLVAVSHADGVIHPKEVAGMEKVYKALGLEPSLAYSDLHAGGVTDGPRTVRPAEAGPPGEAIPKEKGAGERLDASKIAEIRSDTDRVSRVLGDIFEADETEEAAETRKIHRILPGLDDKHGALVLELVSKKHWTVKGFEDLCRKHGLMSSGAFEDVNEWAFDTYDEALLEEYEGYDVSADIANDLRQRMKGG